MKDKKNNKKKTRKPFVGKADRDSRGEFPSTSSASARFCDKRNPVGGDNDWRWYAANPQLVKDTASYPFQFPLGVKHNVDGTDTWISGTAVPGVAALHWDPSIGMPDAEVDPVNIAMRNLYAFIRHANSGHTNYDAPDLMLYLLAMDNVFSYHAMLKRLYGVMRTYSHTNRYVPKALVEAMGIDFDDLQEHLCDLRSYLNTYAVRVGSYCIPATLSYTARHLWMNSHVYVDTDQDKPQLYLYVQHSYYRFGLTDSAGSLTGVLFNTAQSDQIGSFQVDKVRGLTFNQLVDFGNKLLAPVIVSEDFGIMSGDILKAYTPAEIFRVELIPEDYVVVPEYSPEVLDQINNASLLGKQATGIAPTITQTTELNTGYLKEQHTLEWYSNLVESQIPVQNLTDNVLTPGFMSKRFINFDHGDVKPEDVIVATRLTNIPEVLPAGWDTNKKRVKALIMPSKTTGSEVPLFMRILYYQNAEVSKPQTSDNDLVLKSSEMIFTVMATELFSAAVTTAEAMSTVVSTFGYAIAREQMLTKFHRHPLLYSGGFAALIPSGGSVTEDSTHVLDCNGDINYYTIVDKDNLVQMTQMALISEFDVTQYGRKA